MTRRSSGFTLMEVLLAMSLLSIMVVLLFGSLKISAQSWEKGEDKLAYVHEMATVYHFFRQHLSAAKPLWDDFSVSGQRVLTFQGGEQTLQFVGEFPASAAKAGSQLFNLQLVDEGNDEKAIKVGLTPFLPIPPGQDNNLPKEEVVLIRHVKALSFGYFGPSDTNGEGNWQNEWLDRETPPQLVKIGIELNHGGYWPDMIVALKISNADLSSGDGQAASEEQQDNQEDR